jgi:hypothetical protein
VCSASASEGIGKHPICAAGDVRKWGERPWREEWIASPREDLRRTPESVEERLYEGRFPNACLARDQGDPSTSRASLGVRAEEHGEGIVPLEEECAGGGGLRSDRHRRIVVLLGRRRNPAELGSARAREGARRWP